MNQYYDNLNETIKQYFKVLSKEFPDFLYDYIETAPMQRIGKIGCGCGTNYTKVFDHKFFYSNLEHSIAVALIVWNFTKDKKQTLAGLFHDIATPVFKHCIDFMNGDYEKQESTEELTKKIITESKEIMQLLNRDGIKVEEVADYHIYPIADNDTPELSADRLEYNFSNGFYFKIVWNLEEIRKIYENIEVQTNEQKIEELGFKDKEIAEFFIEKAHKLWPVWISKEDKLCMQFIADSVKKMVEGKELTITDLYTLPEIKVVEMIENSKNKQISAEFEKFRNATEVYESDTFVENKYCKSINAKRRYINPLAKTLDGYKRISDVSEIAGKQIKEYLGYKTKKYLYFDF